MEATSGDDLQKKIDDLKKQKEHLDAEKARLDAERDRRAAAKALAAATEEFNQQLSGLQNQKALAEAQKALDQTRDPAAQQLVQLQNQKALLDAQNALIASQKGLHQAQSDAAQQLTDLQNQKALAEAQKALAEAQTQSVLARLLGDVKAGPYSGSVDMKSNAGTEEALLLGARAVKEAAAKVATAVLAKASGLKAIYIFAAKEFPNFQRLLTYRFRQELIKQAFAAAGVKQADEGPEVVATAALISGGVDAFAKILGFFKTDYSIGGLDVKLDESMLLYTVAGQLQSKEVHLPLVYAPKAQIDAMAGLANELSELVVLRNRAATQLDARNRQIADRQQQVAALHQQAADAGQPDTLNPAPDALLRDIATWKAETAQLTSVIALYDAFAGALTTLDANGTVPVSGLIQEYAVGTALKAEAGVLLLRLEHTGGGYLLKKNLFTGLFGEMPLYHMGGATVSYVLLAGDNGHVLAGDMVAVHGGFVSTDKLRQTLEK
jgi:hypothetical protein